MVLLKGKEPLLRSSPVELVQMPLDGEAFVFGKNPRLQSGRRFALSNPPLGEAGSGPSVGRVWSISVQRLSMATCFPYPAQYGTIIEDIESLPAVARLAQRSLSYLMGHDKFPPLVALTITLGIVIDFVSSLFETLNPPRHEKVRP